MAARLVGGMAEAQLLFPNASGGFHKWWVPPYGWHAVHGWRRTSRYVSRSVPSAVMRRRACSRYGRVLVCGLVHPCEFFPVRAVRAVRGRATSRRAGTRPCGFYASGPSRPGPLPVFAGVGLDLSVQGTSHLTCDAPSQLVVVSAWFPGLARAGAQAASFLCCLWLPPSSISWVSEPLASISSFSPSLMLYAST